ncbi:MAG: hypothetical protein ACKV1O_21300 [Saprospiraceae bacterium]
MKELELIIATQSREFPPRLHWQPIFYPVLNFEYAADIAREWNVSDSASGYCGFVTAFELPEAYIETFEVQNVGGIHHNELWVPAEDLKTFNQNIQGYIQVEAAFYGDQYSGVVESTHFFRQLNAQAQFDLLCKVDDLALAEMITHERVSVLCNFRYWQQKGNDMAMLEKIKEVYIKLYPELALSF